MFEIEYQSDYILIINKDDEYIYIICLDEVNPKIEKINTYYLGIDNDMIEEAIEKVLWNSGYDIEYEIEEYRHSNLYEIIEEYNKE